MIVTVHWSADPTSSFRPHAFARNVGKVIPVAVDGDKIVGGTILKAEVVGDNDGLDLTIDIPGEHSVFSATPYELVRAARDGS